MKYKIKYLHLLTTFLLLLGGMQSFAQKQITGSVKNKNNIPILDATIENTSDGSTTKTDSLGRFVFPYENLPLQLKISATGFVTTKFKVTNTSTPLEFQIENDASFTEVVITSRRRKETAQSVPIPITVVGGGQVADAGAFNVERLKEFVPSVQFYSSTPRNTTLNIRGLGSVFGLTNDGIDPGVGFYVDGVYYARPAATCIDFIDIDRIEVLRGPQGTLFGKNTTAGAFNITSKAPTFTPDAKVEVSYGNYNYVQAKATVSGPLIANKLAGRLSFSGTQRNGTLYNTATETPVNTLNNLGIRGQLLYTPSDKTKITLIGDATRQRPNGYALVLGGVVPTLRSSFRQFSSIIKDLGYTLPTTNPFDRTIDQNTPARADNNLGGLSVNVDAKIGPGTLTSTTAWRYWKWNPSNDRDYTGLDALSKSQGNSKHDQWSQELRYAGNISSKVSGVIGTFFLAQNLRSDPVQTEEVGSDYWRFAQQSATGANAYWSQYKDLVDGYGIKTYNKIKSLSAAVFTNIDWAVTDKFHIEPGLRYNYDKKDVVYSRTTYGGQTQADLGVTDAVWTILDSLKKSVYSNQAFAFNAHETNFSGQITLSYRANNKINAYATFATSYKPLGVNVGGLPTGSDGQPLLDLARVKPEKVRNYEVGIKTSPNANSTLNISVYNTEIKDYQTTVQSPEIGVNRGYLANAEKVRVRGAELEGNTRFHNLTIYGALSYTDGKYVKFDNAPLPLEQTGLKDAAGNSIYFTDISGQRLPGISKWSGSLGGEVTTNGGQLFGTEGKFFLAIESSARSGFSSSPTPSAYLNIPGYALFNGRIGFRANKGVTIFVWGRNILNKNYFEQFLVAGGNSGQYGAVLGDPRTYGVTLRYSL
ncbi:MAG: TonB-dependent receptor [Pseudopedobacter saltans]|uniref:TonB-dependent receptor n=1 Tax=Pseudopedobacter saltans TaxID=151895 RepID=A0A2W5ENS3_9SPHI|nr:MAG: TonB-dependent receptor [Pseudopedobacter saltans]